MKLGVVSKQIDMMLLRIINNDKIIQFGQQVNNMNRRNRILLMKRIIENVNAPSNITHFN